MLLAAALLAWTCVASAGAVHVVDVFTPTIGMACPRIPAIVASANGTLLAFAEGRVNSCSDGGAKRLVMSRSFDDGATWQPKRELVGTGSQIIGQPMPVLERGSGRVFVQYITSSGSGIGEANWQIATSDHGATWSEPRDISAFLGSKVGAMNGPGNAIQLNTGRLVFAGHMGAYKEDVVWWSDDGGSTFNLSSATLPKMDEVAFAQLTNGSLMLNMRTNHLDSCNCRAVAVSDDGGESFGPITFDHQLIGPVCQASLVRVGEELHFSNPASDSKRVDITVRRSVNDGRTWEEDAQLIWEEAGPGYSNLVEGGLREAGIGGILFERSGDNGDTISFAKYSFN